MKVGHSLCLAALSLAVLSACNKVPDNKEQAVITEQVQIAAPVAKKIPHEMTIHGDTRIDNYYWMRDDERKDAAVIAHLNAENAYVESKLAHTQTLQNTLFEELKGRSEKDDDTVPTKKGE